jgi:N-acyl-D-amino-acid deacylase
MKKLIALSFWLAAMAASAQPDPKLARLDSVLTYLHDRQLFNGTVLVGEKGKVLYKKAFGFANAGTGEKLTTTSAFNLASVSKQFYAMMIMILKERGKVAYDAPVKQYLSIFPYPDITVRHLLNQTSGLPEYFEIAERNLSLLDTLTNASMLDLLAKTKPALLFKPGEKWQYCNTNYTTLGSIVEVVSGMPADKFFDQAIRTPLHLANTYVYQIRLKSYPPSRVFGFRFEDQKPVPNDLVRLDGIVGDGNIYSSVEDLYQWDQALYTEKLVSGATLQEAFMPGKLNNGQATNYGFGWMIQEPGKVVTHSGGWVGFRTIICRYLDKNQTLIVLDNSSNFYGPGLARNIWEGRAVKIPLTQLITNVHLIDGTGLPAFAAAVRILNSRIGDFGTLTPFRGESVTDGQGLVLAPGFIDSHSHHDRGIKSEPDFVSATNQGITTIVVGQDGDSWPIDSIKASLEKRPVSVNLATYTGHGTLRERAMKGDVLRAASDVEIGAMKSLLDAEMDKGSFGLATGLEYEPEFYATRDEVIALAKVAAAKGGRYISHIRSEDANLEAALEEIIDIGREAKIPVQVSHIKIALRSKWGTAPAIISKLEDARHNGIDITADAYPYTVWMSTPRVLFPKKNFTSMDGARYATRELFDPSASFMVAYPGHPAYEGKTVTEIAALHHETPEAGLLRIIRETRDHDAAIAGASMSEGDVNSFLSWDQTNLCSDGSISGHPRGYGAFPRFLGHYVREGKLMPLEIAVHKITGLTAGHLGMPDRGLIRRGYFADLVLFDPALIADRATITDPTALSVGIEKVWVNGVVVYQHQKAAQRYPGVFISRRQD